MKVFVALCVLTALSARVPAQNETDMSLSCFSCKSGERCHPTPLTCSPPQDSCITIQEYNTLASPTGAEYSGVFQSCADSRRSLTGFLAFYFGGTVSVEIHSEICKRDDCNTESTPARLAISRVQNGRQCPACYAPGFESCKTNGPLPCMGGADQCATVVGTLAQGGVEIPFAARGCATQAACDIKTLESGVFTYKLTKADCSPALQAQTSSATQTLTWGPLGSILSWVSLFLPALLGFFCC
ncbi:phospholipase A2 inhibitor and Ly6/PLAUR domain-containing protein-like isoform X3 [Carettochelys insculpta]